MICLIVSLGGPGSSVPSAGGLEGPATAAAGGGLRGLGSLSELEKTMKSSSGFFGGGGAAFLAALLDLVVDDDEAGVGVGAGVLLSFPFLAIFAFFMRLPLF